MFKKIILIILLSFVALNNAYSADNSIDYTNLTQSDLNTFNEYRVKITDKLLLLKSKYSIDRKINITLAGEILTLSEKGYNYLPDNIVNKNLLLNLSTAIKKGIKYPSSDISEILVATTNYLDKVNIEKIKGTIEAFPDNGNAPLTVTFRGNVKDPTGTIIPKNNYIWWMYVGGRRKIISNTVGPSLNYTFKEEGNFTVFLDVVSDHKNSKGNIDVLPFTSRAEVKINEKIASVIIKINLESLRDKEEIKFTPEEARYGLIFDATSSTPTGGTKFSQTEWDFGDKRTRKYSGSPKIERVVYNKEGNYTVSLKLRTNEGKTVERKFVVIIHDPIATIKTDIDEGYLGDKFNFTAQSGINDDNLNYSWEIIDIKNEKSIFSKSGKSFSYAFLEKGQYNVILNVTEPSSSEPDTDVKRIYINSRAPVSIFNTSIPSLNKPNTILLDGTKSYDPDISDDGKLEFSWIIDGDRVNLENPNFNGSIGYYTFDSIGNHSIVLEVTDPDNITIQEKKEVNITSTLSVDFAVLPRVAQREQSVKFIADSNEAMLFDWDFGDGSKKSLKEQNVEHKFLKSGVYKVKLKVVDKNDNINSFTRDVYIGESDKPVAYIQLTNNNNEIIYKEGVCNGKGAYIINRVDTIKISGEESINIDGLNTGLSYSWKLNNDKLYSSRSFDKKFDELGCFPIKLVVKSDNNGKTDTKDTYIKVENEAPTLSALNITVQNETSDPVIVNITAFGAKDIDGVIQSYLWYYYTDVDPEPQDFRATREPSTNFVLPKITGNYYFAVVMKDNNEVRVNSEQISSSKYFITLSGDNVNTPILDLKVSNTSVSIGEEIVLTAKVKNILDQDITKNVEFSWDLDGDGFYEKDTNKAIIEHKYNVSGEFHPKVKAKYKGFSNTKNVTISVVNVLKPEFSYISIGNDFIFLDNSLGASDSIKWDLGDKTIINDKKYFVYNYTDNLPSHTVRLTLREGTKTKFIEQKVIKNVKNILKINKQGLIVFSEPEIKDEKIELEEPRNIYVYFRDKSEDLKNYVVDFDINYDSDLNGGKDDDEDNKNDSSYTNGGPIFIVLNDLKTQIVRLMTKNSNGEVINSYDFTIEKSYIEEKEIDINTLKFDGVTESEKLKIEQLKEYVQGLSKEHKLKALMYIQKLQEEWGDDREKTNVILEFEAFINETGDPKSEEIINLVESLLVEGDKDQSEKSIIFNALKNLLPISIDCGNEQKTGTGTNQEKSNTKCYDSLVVKLEKIRDNNNIEENKKLGEEILSIIEAQKDTLMTNQEKLDFKAILTTLVYGGLENVPKEKIKEVTDEEPAEGGSNLLSLFLTVLKWLGIIILVFIGVVGLYYIYYKITNKDKNVGFQDFIIDATSPKDKKIENISNSGNGDMKDILGELDEEEQEEKIEIKPEIKEIKVGEKQQEVIQEENLTKTPNNDIPDWLKGSFGGEEKPKEEIIEEKKVEDKIEEKPKDENNNWKLPTNEELEEITKIKDEEVKEEKDNIPDWLKGSFETNEEEIKEEEVKEEIEENIEEPKQEISTSEEVLIPEEKTEVKEEDNIPDWLKGSFEQPKEEESKEIAEEIKEEQEEEKIEEEQEEEKTKKSTTKKKKKKSTKAKEKEEVEEKVKDETKQDESEEETKDKKANGDLWDDGMKIPDWLKTDDKK